jgi:hypothetical protein
LKKALFGLQKMQQTGFLAMTRGVAEDAAMDSHLHIGPVGRGLQFREQLDQRVAYALDHLHARIRHMPASDTRDRVVVDAGQLGHLEPRTVPLVRGKRSHDLREAHARIMPIRLKSAMRIGIAGEGTMLPMEERPLNTAQTNLKALIEASQQSVNSWAVQHNLVQTTVYRIVTGRIDPSTGQLEKIAKAAGIPAWKLLVPGFDPKRQPVLDDELSANERAVLTTFRHTLAHREITSPLSARQDKTPKKGDS